MGKFSAGRPVLRLFVDVDLHLKLRVVWHQGLFCLMDTLFVQAGRLLERILRRRLRS